MSLLDRIITGIEDLVRGPGRTLLTGPMSQEHVDTALADAAAKYKDEHGIALDYKNSIVDLQKLLGQDSSFEGRAALAVELDYPNYKGSAKDNGELVKRVRTEFANRTIQVPQSE